MLNDFYPEADKNTGVKVHKFFKEDWSKEEKSFADNHAAFLESIAEANKKVEPYLPLKLPEKPVKKDEKVSKKEKENDDESLIINDRTNDTNECKEKVHKENKVTGPNSADAAFEDFDDLFGDSSAKNDSQKPKEDAPEETSPVEDKVAPEAPKAEEKASDDDLFSDVEDSDSSEEEVFDTPSTEVDFPPEEAVETTSTSGGITASLENAQVSFQGKDIVSEGHEHKPSSKDILKGFDLESFNQEVKPTIDAILNYVPDIDLNATENNLSNYFVKLDLDKYREDPDMIANQMIKVQSCMDSVMSELIGLGTMLKLVNEAGDFAMLNGILCSSGSSSDKRKAHVQLAVKELCAKLARVDALYQGYDKTYRHLVKQSEILSRLLTAHHERMRSHRFFGPRADQDEVIDRGTIAPVEHKTPAPRVHEPNPTPVSPSQVKEDLDLLDTFDPQKKVVKENMTSGEVDF